jgi:hypothetical protein
MHHDLSTLAIRNSTLNEKTDYFGRELVGSMCFVQPFANNDERMGSKNVKDQFSGQLLGHFPRSTLATSRTAKATTSKM